MSLMRNNETSNNKKRKIHIELTDEIHKRLRVKCAYEDTTIQNFVSGLVKKRAKIIIK
ncbi:MAG: plasmid partition protein ParG [bacterium]